MPVELGIWRLTGGLQRVHFVPLQAEAKLQSILESDLSVLDPGLMLVGRQVQTDHGGFIDILAVDAEGQLIVVELKRGRTPRDVVAQVLDYASWIATLTYEDVTQLFAEQHQGEDFERAFSEHFQVSPPDTLNEDHRLIIVASSLDASTERIIGYLSAGYGVPVNAVFFRYFEEAGNEYLARTWLIDPSEAEAQSERASSAGRKKEPWNGRDYYVSIGQGPARRWEDMRRYGFISAGHGRWYSRSLEALMPGHRVFACIPGTGYVGVGTVEEEVVPSRDFVVDHEGGKLPLLSLPLEAPEMGKHADDDDLCEYVVRVNWLKEHPAERAVWEKGMFANQNSACKLRNRFTLDRLIEAFNLEE